MSVNQNNYSNLVENKNHIAVSSNAHNTIESLEKQAQDTFSVERTPLQFSMQRMGQLQIISRGRGRYNLKNYQNQENLTFVAAKKRFETEFEQQENFVILPKKRKKNAVQIQNFFRIYPTAKKYTVLQEKSDNFSVERKKSNFSIEAAVKDINLKADGKFFYNKPTLKKKRNLEVEYLVVKAPLKQENASLVAFDPHPKESSYKDLNVETKFELFYNLTKVKTFPAEHINVHSNSNLHLPRKVKTSFKDMEIANSSKIELIMNKKKGPYDDLLIDDQPDLFIEENPGKRYVSVGMEHLTFPGNLKSEFCLEIDPNEEIFIPNVYDMLLIQNFWDTLEMNHFRICLRPLGYVSNKNLMNVPDINNKENINENQDNNELEKEGNKDEEKKEDKNNNEEGNDILKRQESNQEGGNKKKSKFNTLKKSIFGKKGS